MQIQLADPSCADFSNALHGAHMHAEKTYAPSSSSFPPPLLFPPQYRGADEINLELCRVLSRRRRGV